MRALLLAAFLLILQNAPIPKGAIQGRLVAADTGEGIPGARVMVRPAGSPPLDVSQAQISGLTDARGRFTVSGLAPGNYIAFADRAWSRGYARQAYGAVGPGIAGLLTGTSIAVTAGKTSEEIVIRLTHGGTISGRVTGIRGVPWSNARIRLHESQVDALGHKYWVGTPFPIEVNSRGEYRASGIDPGTYYLSATLLPAPRGQVGSYAPETVYPSAPDFANATTIDIRSGKELRDLDVQLLPYPRAFRIRGRVIDPRSGKAPARNEVQFFLVPMDRRTAGLRGYIPVWDANGNFELIGIPEGEYWFAVHLRSPIRNPSPVLSAPIMSTFERIDVRRASVVGLVLTPARPARVTGTLRVDMQAPLSLSGREDIRIYLDPTRGAGSFPMNGAPAPKPAEVDADGRFVINDIHPGEYRVKVLGVPDAAYVKEALLDDIDALEVPVTIRKDGQLEVALTKGGGQVEGLVTNGQTVPTPKSSAVLIPNLTRNRVDLYKVTTPDASGKFAFRGVKPEEYKVFVWSNLEPYRYFDPEFVARFEGKGELLQVEEGRSINVSVEQIPEIP
jgi:hypothetical protein